MSGVQLIALGHAALASAHELILVGGGLGLLSILAGLISRRVGALMLLVFLGLGSWRGTTVSSAFSTTTSHPRI